MPDDGWSFAASHTITATASGGAATASTGCADCGWAAAARTLTFAIATADLLAGSTLTLSISGVTTPAIVVPMRVLGGTVTTRDSAAGGVIDGPTGFNTNAISAAGMPNWAGDYGSATFSEGSPVAIAPAVEVSITSWDSAHFVCEGAVVTITNNQQDGDALSLAGADAAITVAWLDDSLTLSGSVACSVYQAALRLVAFDTPSQNPSELQRTLTLTVSNAAYSSAATTVALAVARVNDAPVLSGLAGGITYTEDDAATAVAPSGVSITDDQHADVNQIISATVTITAGFEAGEDVLALGAAFAGVSGVYDAALGVLTLTGTQPDTTYQSVLQSVTFSSSSQNPSTATRTLAYAVNEGLATSASGGAGTTRTVAVARVNDAPTLTTNLVSTSYTENGAAMVLAPACEVLDDMHAADELVSLTVQISANLEAAADLLTITLNADSLLEHSYNAATGALSVSGSDSVANYQKACRAVHFASSSENPSELARTVDFTVQDPQGLSTAKQITLNVVRGNDAPVITGVTGSLTYTENDAPIVVMGSALTLADDEHTDSDAIAGATVRISANLESADVLSLVGSFTGVTAAYNAGAGTLVLSGAASKAVYQAALRAVRYSSSSENPSELARTVQYTVTDASGLASAGGAGTARSIDVVRVNDAPVLAGIVAAPSLVYTENDVATVIQGSGITISDDEHTGANEIASATVTITAGLEASDVLGVSSPTAGVAAAWNVASGTLTLSGTKSRATYQTALQRVTFSSSSDNPSELARTVQYTVDDASGLASAVGVGTARTISVTRVNDAPVISGVSGTMAYTENDAATAVMAAALTVSDDSHSTLVATADIISGATVQITANLEAAVDVLALPGTAASWGGVTAAYTAATGLLTLSGDATKAVYQAALRAVTYSSSSENPSELARTVQYTVTDASGLASAGGSDTRKTVSVGRVDDAPVISGITGHLFYEEQQAATAVLDGSGTLLITDDEHFDVDRITGATVTIATNLQAGTDVLMYLPPATLGNVPAESWDGTTGVLTLTGTATKAHYAEALTYVLYSSSSDSISTAPRTVQFVVSDGALDSPAAARAIQFNAVNDAPTVTWADAGQLAVDYVENGAPLAVVQAGLTLTDPDSANMHNATVRVSAASFQAGGDALALPSPVGAIVGAWSAAAGALHLTLTGAGATATKAEFQAALRSVTFASSSPDISVTQRALQYEVCDDALLCSQIPASSAVNVARGEPAALVFSTQPAGRLLGGQAFGTQPRVEIRDAAGALIRSSRLAVAVGKQTGPAAGSLLGVSSRTAALGIVDFGFVAGTSGALETEDNQLALDAAGTYSLQASIPSAGGGSITTTSADVAVGIGPVFQLRFDQQPADAVAGAGFQAAVSAQDKGGNVNGTAGTVTASPLLGPDRDLDGGFSAPTAAGVATLAGMVLRVQGTYLLSARMVVDGRAVARNSTAFVISPAAFAVGPTVAPLFGRPGVTGPATVSFTLTNPWPADGKVVIEFPSTFTGIEAAPTVSWAGGAMVASTTGKTVTAARSGGTLALPAGSAVSFTLSGVTNPASEGAAVLPFPVVQTTTADSTVAIDQSLGVVAGLTMVPSPFSAGPTVAQTSAVAAALVTVTFEVTLANPLPAAGRMLLTFPSGFVNARPQAAIAVTDISADGGALADGFLTCTSLAVTASGADALVLSTPAAAAAATAAGTVLRFSIANVTNPVAPGPAGAFAEIATATDGDVRVDEATVRTATASAAAVTDALELTAHPFVRPRTADSAAPFEVRAAGGTLPYSYQWLKGGVAVAGATEMDYTIAPLEVADAGSFTCIVTDSTGPGSPPLETNTATLVVNPVLRISGTTAPQHIVKFAAAAFDVAVQDGTPPYAYQWLHNGTAVAGATARAYSIASAVLAHQGNYSCVVTDDGAGAALTSEEYLLTVNAPPTLAATVWSVDENSAEHALLEIVSAAGGGEDPGSVLSAHAADENPGDALAYSISAGNGQGYFRVDATTGQLSVSRGGSDQVSGLNHEAYGRFDLVVRAVDDGDPPLAVTASCQINVVDVNDAPTLFDVSSGADAISSSWSNAATESTGDGVVHGLWAAADSAGLVSTFNSSGMALEPQRHDLQVVRSHDSVSSAFDLTAQAHTALRVRARLWLSLADAAGAAGVLRVQVDGETVSWHEAWRATNESCPFGSEPAFAGAFPRPPAAVADASLPSLACSVFVDVWAPHTAGAATVGFSWAPAAGFTSSPGWSWGFGRVHVSADAMRAVAENSAVGTLVGVPVVAVDEDLDLKNVTHHLLYSIVGGSGASVFSIDRLSGQISVAASVLDFEGAPTYVLVVQARDNYAPAVLVTSANVTVMIGDENDPPVFSVVQTLVVDESTPEFPLVEGTRIGFLNATDDDVHRGSTGLDSLQYDKFNQSEVPWMYVNTSTGEATFVVPAGDSAAFTLDYETANTFPLEVSVRDAADTGADASVTVLVRDVNERPLWCCGTGVPIESCFNALTSLQMTVGEGGKLVVGPSCQTDVGSESSQIVPDFEVEENTAFGTHIGPDGQLTGSKVSMGDYVYDADTAQVPPTQLFFNITSGNAGGFLGINHTSGQMAIARDGLSIGEVPSGRLELVITVTDNGPYPFALNASTAFKILIKNTNDKPVFPCDAEVYCGDSLCRNAGDALLPGKEMAGACKYDAFENSATGTVVAIVAATDPESVNTPKLNQTISYSITQSDGGSFGIRSVFDSGRGKWVGQIYMTENTLDYEGKQTEYRLQIYARDDGIIGGTAADGVTATSTKFGPKDSFGIVLIRVLDIQDRPLLLGVLSSTQNGLATSGSELVALSGIDMGQLSQTDIVARYGKGNATQLETQRFTVIALGGSIPSAANASAAPAHYGSFGSFGSFGSTTDAAAVVGVSSGGGGGDGGSGGGGGADLSGVFFTVSLFENYTTALISPSASTAEFAAALVDGLPHVLSVVSVVRTEEPAAAGAAVVQADGAVVRYPATNYSWTVVFGLTAPGADGLNADYGNDLPRCGVAHPPAFNGSGIVAAGVAEITDGAKGRFWGDDLAANNESSQVLPGDDRATIKRKLDGRIFTTSHCTVRTENKVVECQSSPGYGTDHLWQIVISQSKSNIVNAWTSYAPPTIIRFDGAAADNSVVTRADTSGGQKVFLAGTQFGTEIDSAVTNVTYGRDTGTEYSVTNYSIATNHTRLECVMEQGYGSSLKWIVTVAGQTSDTPTTSYAKPAIESIGIQGTADGLASTEGNDTVVLTGRNFGPVDNPELSVAYGRIGEGALGGAFEIPYSAQDCQVVEPHREIHCKTSEGFGDKLRWQVQVGDLTSDLSNSTSSYSPPCIERTDTCDTGSTPGAGGTGGDTSLCLIGRNFGGFGVGVVYFGLGSTAQRVVYTGKYSAKALTYGDTLLSFSTGAGVGTDKPIYITVGTQTSNIVRFTYDPPVVSDFDKLSGNRGSLIQIRISGNNFAANRNSLGTVAAAQSAENKVEATKNAVVFPPPVVCLYNTSAQAAAAKAILLSKTAALAAARRAEEEASYGGSMTCINATNDAANATNPTANTANATANATGDTPDDDAAAAPDDDAAATGPSAAAAPRYASYASYVGGGAARRQLKASEAELPAAAAAPRCWGEPVGECAVMEYSSTSVRCNTEQTEAHVLLEAGGQAWVSTSEDDYYSYSNLVQKLRPLVTAIEPATGGTLGGGLLTITGENLGDGGVVELGFFSQSGSVFRTCEWQNLDGLNNGTRYQTLAGVSEIVCRLPPGQGKVFLRVLVSYSDYTTTTIQYTYQKPEILSIAPEHGPTCGNPVEANRTCSDARRGTAGACTCTGTLLTVTGTDFGDAEPIDGSEKRGEVFLQDASGDEVECRIVTYSHTQVTCWTPEGIGRSHTVRLRLAAGGLDSAYLVDAPLPFHYDAPVVRAMTPAHGPASGRQECNKLTALAEGKLQCDKILVTLTGSNFGHAEGLNFNGLGKASQYIASLLPAAVVGAAQSQQATACTIVQHDHDLLVFALEEGLGANQTAALQVAGQVAQASFDYDPPVVTRAMGQRGDQVEGTNMPSPRHPFNAMGDVISIYGKNFGMLDPGKALLITVGGEPCVAAQGDGEGGTSVWVKDTQLKCQTPTVDPASGAKLDGAGMVVGNHSIVVTVLEQVARHAGSGEGGNYTQFRAGCPTTNDLFFPEGMYGEVGENCLPCPPEAKCGDSHKPPTIGVWPVARQGYWQTDRSEFISCQPPESCPSGEDADVTCQAAKSDTGSLAVLQAPGEEEVSVMSLCNPCATGYAKDRCAECDCPGEGADCFYRDLWSGLCEACPTNSGLLLLLYLAALVLFGVAGYKIHRKGPNLAAFAIGIEYFQVLSMFANLKFNWPPYVKSSFEVFSLAMGSFEVTSPECSVKLSYVTKWYMIQSIPVVLAVVLLTVHYSLYMNKKVHGRHGADKYKHVSQLISLYLNTCYFLFIYITKTTLQVFSCEEKGGGRYYLRADPSIPCFGSSYETMTTTALTSVALFSFGYPVALVLVLSYHRKQIMQDQVLWSKGLGDKEENPNYYIRKKYGKLYQQFKPHEFYWVVVLLFRKLSISLIISVVLDPLFAASCTLLVLFMCLLMHREHLPFLSPSDYDQFNSKNKGAAGEASTAKGPKQGSRGQVEADLNARRGKAHLRDHPDMSESEKQFVKMELPVDLSSKYHVPVFTGIKEGQNKTERRFLLTIKRDLVVGDPVKKSDLHKLREVLANHRYRYLQTLVLYNYNKMETRFLVSGIFILVCGIMLSSAADKSKPADNKETMALGYAVMVAVCSSTGYFFFVMFTEGIKYYTMFKSVSNWVVHHAGDNAVGDVKAGKKLTRFKRLKLAVLQHVDGWGYEEEDSPVALARAAARQERKDAKAAARHPLHKRGFTLDWGVFGDNGEASFDSTEGALAAGGPPQHGAFAHTVSPMHQPPARQGAAAASPVDNPLRNRAPSTQVDWDVFGGGDVAGGGGTENPLGANRSDRAGTLNPMMQPGPGLSNLRGAPPQSRQSAFVASHGLDTAGVKARGWSIFMGPEERDRLQHEKMQTEHSAVKAQAHQRRQTKLLQQQQQAAGLEVAGGHGKGEPSPKKQKQPAPLTRQLSTKLADLPDDDHDHGDGGGIGGQRESVL
jgi:hypothetical protein